MIERRHLTWICGTCMHTEKRVHRTRGRSLVPHLWASTEALGSIAIKRSIRSEAAGTCAFCFLLWYLWVPIKALVFHANVGKMCSLTLSCLTLPSLSTRLPLSSCTNLSWIPLWVPIWLLIRYTSKCMYLMYLCVYHVHIGAYGGQKRGSYALELELQKIVSHPLNAGNWTQVKRTANTLNFRAYSPTPICYSLITHTYRSKAQLWSLICFCFTSYWTCFIHSLCRLSSYFSSTSTPLIPWTPLLLRFPWEFILFCVVVFLCIAVFF